MKKNRQIGKVSEDIFVHVHADAKKCDNHRIIARANGISKETVRRILGVETFAEYRKLNDKFAKEQRRKRCDVEPTQSKLFDTDVVMRVICHSKEDADLLCVLAERLNLDVGFE